MGRRPPFRDVLAWPFMRIIEFTHPHEHRQFEVFRSMIHPHFGVSATVEIGEWLELVHRRGVKTTPAIVHLLARVANEIPQLRRRIRGDTVVEHETVHPTFSVATDVADAFSFCHVPFDPDLKTFVDAATATMGVMRGHPVFEDEPDRDDYLFMSALPWISFTSVQHAMHYHPHDSVPRITWGKFFEAGERTMMPLSLHAHHALVDGVHAGRFFEGVEAAARSGG